MQIQKSMSDITVATMVSSVYGQEIGSWLPCAISFWWLHMNTKAQLQVSGWSV